MDIRTLAVTLSLVNVLHFAALVGQYRANPRQAGVAWWTLGNAALAAGFALNFFRDAPRFGPTAIVLNSALFVGGLGFIYVGLLRFFGRGTHAARMLALLGAYVLLIAWFTYVHDSLAARRALLSGALAILSFLIAWTAHRSKGRSVAIAGNLLSALFFAHGLFFLARTLTAFGGASGEGLFTPSSIQTATYLVALSASTMWTFGFILLVNQHLTAEAGEAREQLERVFEVGPDAAILTREDDGRIVKVNAGFSALFGYAPHEAMGRSTRELGLWSRIEERERILESLRRTGSCEDVEATFVSKDGSERTAFVSAKTVQLRDVPHVISVARDVTERKRVEAALRESEERHRVLFQGSPEAYVIIVDGLIIECNRAAEQALRARRDEIVGRTPGSISPELQPDGRPSSVAAEERMREAQARGTTTFEWIHRRMDGSNFHAEVALAAMLLDGKPALFATWRDITVRKRAETLIRSRLELMDYSASHSLPQVLQKTLDVVGELTDSSVGFYHFVERGQQVLSLQACSTRTPKELRQARGEGQSCPIDDAGSWADAARTKAPVIRHDDAVPVTRELVVPVLRDDRVVALLGVGNKPDEYTDADVGLVQYFADVAWEIAERKRGEERLRESEEKFRTMAELLPQIVFEANIQGELTYVNKQAFTLFGYPEDTPIVGTPSLHFHVPEERARVVDSIRRRAMELPVESNEYRMLRRDGTTFPALVYSTPIVNRGRPVGLRGLIIDITERKEAEERAKAAATAKSAFLANMSHELRTPLNAILGFSRLMRGADNLTGAQRDNLTTIHRSGEHLLSLVNQVLDMAKLEAGRHTYEPAPLDLARLLDEVRDLFRLPAESRGLELRVHLGPSVPTAIVSDEAKLRQILINLVGNAIKFTASGSVALRANARGGKLELQVEDTGPGIEAADREAIFEAFVQSSTPGRHREGTGLGLSISREFARLLGGELVVTSEGIPGRGSTFTLTIPLQVDANRAAEMRVTSPPAQGPRPSAAPPRETAHVALDPAWCEQVRRATVEADLPRLRQLIEPLRLGAPAVAERMLSYVDAFEYERIGTLLEELERTGG